MFAAAAAASLENDLAINIIIQPDFDTLLPSAGSLEPAVANALVEFCFFIWFAPKEFKSIANVPRRRDLLKKASF